MALVPDYDPNEENDRARGPSRTSELQSGGSPLGATPATAQQSRPSTLNSNDGGFVPWSRFVSANRAVSEREAGKLAQGVQSDVNDATARRDAASAGQAAGVESNYQHPQTSFGESSTASAFGAPSAGKSQLGVVGAPEKQAAQSASHRGELADVNADGASNLEEQLGAPAWQSLIGDTAKAQQEASALGSESGVQALLQKRSPSPSSAFDAALIGGAGGQQFRDIAKQSGGTTLTDQLLQANQGAVDRWQSLLGDIEGARSAQDAAAQQAAARQTGGDPDRARQQIQEHLAYLNQKFPLLAIAKDKDTLLAYMNAHSSNVGADASAQQSWANSIYGPNTGKAPSTLVIQLYNDIKKMTPEEFALFAQGFVPPWMGLGTAAMGSNGGFWWGFRNSNRQVGGASVKDVTNMSDEDRRDYEDKMKALSAFYDVLAAALAATGPVGAAAAGVGRGVQGGTSGV